MILGKIAGKTSTLEFNFVANTDVNKFDYVQTVNKDNYVLAQILEIEKTNETTAKCNIIGYREDNRLKQLLNPLNPGSEVLMADNEFIQDVLNLKKRENSAFIGKLNRYDLNVYLDLDRLLTKHVSILAKSGSGKSYASGVLVEEILERGIPLLIIDPHAEYLSLKEKNENIEELSKFGLSPKNFSEKVRVYSPNIQDNPDAIPLRLSNFNLSSQEIIHILPTKLSNVQLSLLYSCLNDVDRIDFNKLILDLEMEENPMKYNLINTVKYLEKLNLFSDSPTSLNDLISPGKCSVINLRGVYAELQEVVVYKLMKDLFEERKKGNVPPFFTIIEEAHNYLPERSFGEAKSSRILRQIASEGRKFGLGLCVISQRPSRLDKSVISQTSTQIILKVTNPNDLRALASSVEGLTYNSEKEIQNLEIGTALITGVSEMPLFVNIRPRMTKHGGEATNMLEAVNEGERGELMQVIKQKISRQDMELIGENMKAKLIPCLYIQSDDFNLLFNLNNGKLVKNIKNGDGAEVIKEINLSSSQKRIFDTALSLKEFSAAEMFSKSGVQFSDLHSTLNILCEKRYLVKEGNNFRLGENFRVDLNEFSIYDKPEFKRVEGEKVEKKVKVYDVLNFVNNLAKVNSYKECWLEIYALTLCER
ncbi:ATP-binding protein [Candidatus Woesearchaeota archaeon]|nr:hypothetical protein [uncultured archaeon]MBS3150256.1 ATP-binding protein [Candidatus Woesearchaeota archaeon]